MQQPLDYEPIPEDFDGFYSHTLRFYYEAAAAIRASASVRAFKFTAMASIFMGAMWLTNKNSGYKPLLLWGVAAGLIYWLWTSPKFKGETYATTLPQIRQEVMDEIVRFVHPEWRFSNSSPQLDREFLESGLFPGKIEFVHEAHCVAGMASGRAMAAVTMDAGYFVEESVGSGNTRRKVKVPKSVFKGLFVAIELPKELRGWVTVHRDRYEKTFGWLSNEFRRLGDQALVRLENPDFENTFKVRSNDPVLAHYVLPSTMMETLLRLDRLLSSSPFVLSFKGSTLYFALPWEGDVFSFPASSEEWLNAARRDAVLVSLLKEIVHEVVVC